MPEEENNPEDAKNAGKKLADSGRAYLKWAKGVADTVPNVLRIVDGAELLCSTFDSPPEPFQLTHFRAIQDGIAAAQSFLDSQPPAAPEYRVVDISDGSGASSVTASANYAAMELIALSTSGSQSLRKWAGLKLIPLQKLQQTDLNKAAIASNLQLLHQGERSGV